MAADIAAGLADAAPAPEPSEFVGEKDPFVTCGTTPKGTPSNFQCAVNDFSCIGTTDPNIFACFGANPFSCKDVFGKCGGQANSFDCNNNYDCTGNGGGEEFYDCWDYGCGDAGGPAGSFDCDAKFDFMCDHGGFECHDDFDCNGGHVFLCTTDHECNDSFNCSSAGGTKCDKNFPYGHPDSGGNDTTPGDFVCGFGDGNKFECNDDFDCSAKDEFDCWGNNEFDCIDDFDCGAAGGATQFECDTDFECHEGGDFDCVTDFDCTADGGNSGQFDCTDDFDCGAGGDAASGTFSCATDFDCKPDSQFDCKCKFSGTDKPDPKPPQDGGDPKPADGSGKTGG